MPAPNPPANPRSTLSYRRIFKAVFLPSSTLIVLIAICVFYIASARTQLTNGISKAIASRIADPEPSTTGGAELSAGYLPAASRAGAEALLRSAEEGDAQAQFKLGVMYATGDGADKDPAEAAKWFTRAAEQGLDGGQYFLGLMYATGSGIPKDPDEAVKWYTRAAEQGDAGAQFNLGFMYATGETVPKNAAEAAKWYTRAAEQGNAGAQLNLAIMHAGGEGVPKNAALAAKWYTLAAEQGNSTAQYNLALLYAAGDTIPRNTALAVKWYTRAAEQGNAAAQLALGLLYATGEGVTKNSTEAYVWCNLAAAHGQTNAATVRDTLEKSMTPEQITEAQRLSSRFMPKQTRSEQKTPAFPALRADQTGSGFFITTDGYFVTNHHVIADARRVTVRTAQGSFTAAVVRDDAANDLALLRVTGAFPSLHVRGSTGVRPADRVSTVGYPNPSLQGVFPKFSSGEVSALTGPADDPRILQVSVPLQPGNSGGPLVDARGNVVGVVVGRLDQLRALKATGQLPENVNYAIKGTLLVSILESVPGLSEKLAPAPSQQTPDAAAIARSVEAATGMVLVER
ncbi:MAG: trypsin-like peptidase domain-containing protein [Planctomycetes bacterium]|nr:trypsin-like peptidase domain-containing protein [Planctomycetota bacterium]